MPVPKREQQEVAAELAGIWKEEKKASVIVAPAAVPVTNNLPIRACEHFCQQAKRVAGGCQKM